MICQKKEKGKNPNTKKSIANDFPFVRVCGLALILWK